MYLGDRASSLENGFDESVIAGLIDAAFEELIDAGKSGFVIVDDLRGLLVRDAVPESSGESERRDAINDPEVDHFGA